MIRAAKQFHVFWLLVGALMVWSGFTYAADPKTNPRATQEAKDIEQVIRIMNGTWILKKRTNPDGSLQQWKGTTTINLRPFYPLLELGAFAPMNTPRALGTITVQETGVHSSKCGCVPEFMYGKPGKEESNGTWTVSLLPKDHAINRPANDKEFFVSVTDVSRTVGDEPWLQGGWNQNIVAYYRIARGKSSATLLNPVGVGQFEDKFLPTKNNGEVIPKDLLNQSA